MATYPSEWIPEVSSSSKRRLALITPVLATALAGGVVTATPAAAETLSPGEVAGVVSGAGLPCVTATAVALAESGGDTNATGAAGEQGLLQIHPMHGKSGMYDPHANAAYAAELHAEQGWGPWAAHSNGSYRQYLGEARAACGGSKPQPEPQPEPEPAEGTPSKSAPQPDSEPASASGSGGATYEVRSGDTLSGIASERDTTWRHLAEMNTDRIDDPDLIYVGQTLDVSGHPRT